MGQRPQSPAKRPTAERLRRRALFYLQRFATSRAHLRFVLLRRAKPEAAFHGIDMREIEDQAGRLLDELERMGLINDRLFAEQQFAKLMRKGTSEKLAARQLAQKGIPAAIIEELLGQDEDADLKSAIALAKRKRIGPWRQKPLAPELERRELAVFARAGFSYQTAKRVMDGRLDGLDL